MRNGPRKATVAPLCALALALMAGASGCRKAQDPQWDVDLFGPLVHASLTIGDLVADSLLTTADDGALTLLYRSELFGVRMDTLLHVPDTSITYSYVLPFPGPLFFSPGAMLPADADVTTLDLDGVQLRTLEVLSGRLELDLSNMIQSGITGTFSLPGATLNGQPVTMQGLAPQGTPQAPSHTLLSRDLAGHRFDLRGPGLDQVNTLASQMTVQLDPNGAGANVTHLDSVKAVAAYKGIVPRFAKGYFGHRTETVGPDGSALDLFGNIRSGLLDIDQAEARIRITNGIGADVRARLHELVSENARTGADVPLVHAIVGAPINLTRALDLGNAPLPTEWSAVLNTGNSNLAAFIENLPDRLRYRMDLELNPLGDISNGNDFLYHESAISARLELEMPLRLIATDLTVQRIAEVELPGTAAGHGLNEGVLSLVAVNGFPFRARLLLDIADAQGQVVATIPVTGEVASGEVGPDGLVRHPMRSVCTAALTRGLVDQLYAEPRLRIRAVLNTTDQGQHLPLMADYKMDLRIVAGVNYTVNGDE